MFCIVYYCLSLSDSITIAIEAVQFESELSELIDACSRRVTAAESVGLFFVVLQCLSMDLVVLSVYVGSTPES